MLRIVKALACFACACHGFRLSRDSEESLGRSYAQSSQEQIMDFENRNRSHHRHSKVASTVGPLRALTSLLRAVDNPAVGWQVIGHRLHSTPLHHHGCAPIHRTTPACTGIRNHQRPHWLLEGLPPRLHARHADAFMQSAEAVGSVSSDNVSSVKPSIFQKIRQQWVDSCKDFKKRPFSYITIPLVAACVGYITNWVGVKMLFYPVSWTGIPLLRYPEQPFGWLGWQGIVPSKRLRMAHTMVDVTISKLLNVAEIFKRLDPRQMAKLLEPDVRSKVLGGFSPPFVNRFFLARSCNAVIKRAPEVVDIRSLVVSGLATDKTTLSNFFQSVGRKELKFLIDSGFGVGFLLGLVQMLFWMIFPKPWTFPLVGSIVGYITNWVALKWIFEPLNPTRIGPFVLQGMFLQRQPEVAEEFSEYIAGVTLASRRVWADVLDGKTTPLFTKLCGSQLPLPRGQVRRIVSHLKSVIGSGQPHPLHDYTDATLGLRKTLETKMKQMSSAEFEQVLHPIFQEDELTLILAGAVLGGAAGALQWWQNDKIDNWINGLQVKFDKFRTNTFGKKGTSNSTLPATTT
mmetsp:Transcript_63307/g.119901  ORF Transcript_63307/g.119901 Transcript_63307/m.119901 type:complete len:571 (+) Transcript_63307:81-1793(+)